MTVEDVKKIIKHDIRQKEELSDYFADTDEGASLDFFREARTLKAVLYEIERKEEKEEYE